MLKRTMRASLLVALLLGATAMTSTVTSAVTASPASALCAPSTLDGTWRNINPSTNAMTKIVIETCQPITTCSGNICSTQYDAGTFMTPFGKCSPTDCNWGRRLATAKPDGWIQATYPFGFKTSYVWAKTYAYYGRTYLRLWVNNDFSAADGRTDYITDEWFLL